MLSIGVFLDCLIDGISILPFLVSFALESEILEAQALYDFKARSSREVNFHKGETIILYKQVSNDWWRGSVNGREGLIQDKYIMLKIRFVLPSFNKISISL